MPRPSLLRMSCLLASDDNRNKDFGFVRSLWSAFDRYSNRYRIERACTQILAGDCVITHLETGEQATVEIKSSSSTIRGNGDLGLHFISELSPTCLWDFLLGRQVRQGTKTDSEQPNFWFFSRHDLPYELFQMKQKTGRPAFVWPEPSLDFFNRCKVNWESDREVVRRLEALLDSHRTTNTYRASGTIPFSRTSAAHPTGTRRKLVQPPAKGEQRQ